MREEGSGGGLWLVGSKRVSDVGAGMYGGRGEEEV